MFDDRSPIYRQIAEHIKAEILSGELAEDSQVMSTNQYAAAYRINPATAAKGLRQLIDDGILYKRRGIGMFVSPDAHDKLRTASRDRFFDDVVDPMVEQALTIGIPLDDVVEHIQRKDGKST
ncbi:MAG TPA: GntR family transcriptional regulator [Candidatus Stackebrandtia excrementipullorum]|nr:GntR family transcriptional regulator [Candidatus Stackebrandtia excrementipullorum]